MPGMQEASVTTRSTIGQRPAKNALFDGFAAVANGRRVKIIELLAQGERSVEHIADSIDQSVANTSHHPEVARTVLNPRIGEAIAALAGWPGTRVIQDNVLWKPMGARSVGYHRDNQYLAWFAPREMYTCWIALDDTTEVGGTLEFARGSHKWPTEDGPLPQFHVPEDYRAPVNAAAFEQGQNVDIAHVEVSPGAGSFHHGWTWHGSGPNHSFGDRRALVIHCASSEATFDRDGMQLGTGPIYTRYAHLTDDVMDENYFPITWTTDGYRTPGLPGSDD